MRRTAIGALAAAILLIPGLAAAQSKSGPREGAYLDLRGGGYAVRGAPLEWEVAFETALGQAFANNFRAEIALGYRNTPTNIGGAHGYFGMLNGYYDFDFGGLFTPFIGLGGGGAVIDAKLVSDYDVVYAYRGIAGVSYDSSRGVSFNLSYNYFSTDNPRFTIAPGFEIESRIRAHVVMLGVRLDLGDFLTCCRRR